MVQLSVYKHPLFHGAAGIPLRKKQNSYWHRPRSAVQPDFHGDDHSVLPNLIAKAFENPAVDHKWLLSEVENFLRGALETADLHKKVALGQKELQLKEAEKQLAVAQKEAEKQVAVAQKEAEKQVAVAQKEVTVAQKEAEKQAAVAQMSIQILQQKVDNAKKDTGEAYTAFLKATGLFHDRGILELALRDASKQGVDETKGRAMQFKTILSQKRDLQKNLRQCGPGWQGTKQVAERLAHLYKNLSTRLHTKLLSDVDTIVIVEGHINREEMCALDLIAKEYGLATKLRYQGAGLMDLWVASTDEEDGAA